ncbi:MAG: O-methyltransferase [Bacteroidales bacterium]|nr:O-methyltransferase [Bacteroidales bacterium]
MTSKQRKNLNRDSFVNYEETEDALDAYVRSHIDAEPGYLHQVQRLTHLRLTYSRMCSGHIQGRLLKMLCQLANAHRILELGTFSGYSALSMAEALTPDPINGQAELHTIEVFDELEDFEREMLAKAGELGQKIHLHIGDALQLIPQVSQEVGAPWDVCFIDADKRIYDEYFKLVLPHMKPGGLIICDNTLWAGKVLDPSPKESDLQTRGLQRFNDMIATDNRVEKVILPMRDGLTLLRVKPTACH